MYNLNILLLYHCLVIRFALFYITVYEQSFLLGSKQRIKRKIKILYPVNSAYELLQKKKLTAVIFGQGHCHTKPMTLKLSQNIKTVISCFDFFKI